MDQGLSNESIFVKIGRLELEIWVDKKIASKWKIYISKLKPVKDIERLIIIKNLVLVTYLLLKYGILDLRKISQSCAVSVVVSVVSGRSIIMQCPYTEETLFRKFHISEWSSLRNLFNLRPFFDSTVLGTPSW
jgi:hypothetical protein